MISDLCVHPTSTPRKAILENIGIIEDLVHLRIIVQHPQWSHNPEMNIQLVIWVVIHLVLVLVMVKVFQDLGTPTLTPRRLIVGLMLVIVCDTRVGNIHP